MDVDWRGRPRRRRTVGDEDVHRQRGKLERGPPQEIDVTLRSAIFKGDVLAHDVAIIAQALPEVMPYRGIFIANDADARNPLPVGCARAESGHAAAAPPNSVINSRRVLIRSPRRRGQAA